MTKKTRRTSGLALLLTLLVVVCLLSIAIGSRVISISEVWDALWAENVPGAPDAVGIVQDLRVPRTILGLIVGLSIGAAGALTQGHTRNPLSDPGILGVNAGAACAVVTGVYVLGITTPIQYMGFGLIGALIAASLVFFLASVGRGASPLTLILAGTGLSATLTAITSAIVLVDSKSLDAWRFWQVGSVAGRGTDVIYATLPFIIPGLILSLGDDMTKALGSRVMQVRIVGIVSITLLVGAATAACGPVVFLGLVAPHVARFFTGPDYRWIVPYSALIGAVSLIACDVVGRMIARPGEVQASIVLAAVGAPFFIALVRAKKLVAV